MVLLTRPSPSMIGSALTGHRRFHLSYWRLRHSSYDGGTSSFWFLCACNGSRLRACSKAACQRRQTQQGRFDEPLFPRGRPDNAVSWGNLPSPEQLICFIKGGNISASRASAVSDRSDHNRTGGLL